MLCEAHASECVPDVHGYTPLDYAGLFDHKNVINYLVRLGWEKCKLTLENEFSMHKDEFVVAHECLFNGPEHVINPIYRSTLLYWACYLDEKQFNWREVR